MKLLYISALIAPQRIEQLQKLQPEVQGNAMHKFNRLVCEGFVENGQKVSTLSAIPASESVSKKFFAWHKDVLHGVTYRYIPFVNIKGLRHLCLFVYTFLYVLIWGMVGRRHKAVVCDMLAISVNMAVVAAAKLNGVKICGILTDMPGLMVDDDSNQEKKTLKKTIVSQVNKAYLSSFDCYVFLTEAMNDILRGKKKPYIVMEGLVDKNAMATEPVSDKHRRVVYAGGLHARYGVNMLVEAFMKLPFNDVTLDLFGAGPSVTWIQEQAAKDPRIVYHGVVSNQEVVDFERSSLLLVNPRPTHEAFTRYSFPSKNMEYMSTGTPVLTTKLPGMPIEYYSHVFVFENETVEDYCQALNHLLQKNVQEMALRGEEARIWVLNHKNNKSQTARICELLLK